MHSFLQGKANHCQVLLNGTGCGVGFWHAFTSFRVSHCDVLIFYQMKNKLSNNRFFMKLSQFFTRSSESLLKQIFLSNLTNKQKLKEPCKVLYKTNQNNKQKMKHDASQSRYLRNKYAKQGIDQQEEQQENQFGQNLQKALDTFGKKEKKKDIESQVQYFGHMIEPFNMRQEEEMGDIDQEGYFVFKRRGEYRDAWLESIQEGSDMMVADRVKKKIKVEGVTFKGLYDEDKYCDRPDDQKINQAQEEEDNDENEDIQNDQRLNHKKEPSQGEESDKGLNLQPEQIKQLICELLPMNKSANTFVKELKKKIKDPETKELHDKILQLCNMYIEKTNQYDILTSKKEQLEVELGSGYQDEQKSQQINWDDEGNDQDEHKDDKNGQKMKMKQQVQIKVQRKNENSKGNRNNSMDQNIKRNKNNSQAQQGNYSDDDIF